MAFHFCLCLLFTSLSLSLGLPRWPHSDCAGNTGNAGSIPGFGRFPRVEHGNPLQDSCLGNPMERGAWQAVVQRVSKSRTRLNMHAHCLHNAYSDARYFTCNYLKKFTHSSPFSSLILECWHSLLPSPVWPLPICLDSWNWHSRFLCNIALYSIGPCFYHQSHSQLGVVFALTSSLHSFWSYFSTDLQ